jgi:hypothetical protein
MGLRVAGRGKDVTDDYLSGPPGYDAKPGVPPLPWTGSDYAVTVRADLLSYSAGLR